MENTQLKEDVERTMTTRELATALNVSNMAIKRVLDKTNNLNGSVKVENGKPTYFTEAQATAIKLELQRHHNITDRTTIDQIGNDSHSSI